VNVKNVRLQKTLFIQGLMLYFSAYVVLKQAQSVIYAPTLNVKPARKKNLMTLDLPFETANFIVAAVIIISIVSIIAKAVSHVKGKK
jgi:hypothetical protein